MTAREQDFYTYTGDDVGPMFQILDADGNPLDMSRADNIFFAAYYKRDKTKTITKTMNAGDIQIVNVSNVQVSILHSDTADMEGEWQFTLTAVDAFDEYSTLAEGTMLVRFRVPNE